MATKLKNIIRVTAAAPGVTVSAHELNVEGTAVVPDKIEKSTDGSFSVTADATNLTITNFGGVAADIDVYVEYWHSIERVFGTAALTPQPFQPSSGGANTMRFADDGSLLDAYVDGVNGDDANSGLSALTALQTVQEVYRKFPMRTFNGSRLRIHLAGVGGFGASATAPLTYQTGTLWCGGGGDSLGNDYQYMGPEMVPFTPATGPATAALDVVPAVAVAGGSAKAGGTLSVRFDFTVAAPGWTVNDFQGAFLRITRGGVKVVWEMPIARNTANAVTCRVQNVAPLILATDTAEIVEPGVRIVHPTDPSSGPMITGTAGIGMTYYVVFGASFVRCCFPLGALVKTTSLTAFDRCNLDSEGYGLYIDDSNLDFVNCSGQYVYISGGHIGSGFCIDPVETTASDPILANRKPCSMVQLAGDYAYLEISSCSRASKINVYYDLAIDAPYTNALYVHEGGELSLWDGPRGVGYPEPCLQGELIANGNAIWASRGGRLLLRSNVATPGVTSLYCTVGGVPLSIHDGAGASCDYGNGVGEWEEAAGYAGALVLLPVAGAYGDPRTAILAG